MDFHLKNKTAIVCAASKGLGRAIAAMLSAEGANVVIGSRNEPELQRTAAAITAETGNKVVPLLLDVSNPNSIEQFIKKASDEFGVIDILVNNSGGPPFSKFEAFDDLDWERAFNLTLMSFARASRLVLPYMKQAGSGRIINIVSGSVKSVLNNSVLSTSMRMGVVGMAKLLADELGPFNITVNNVAPGMILTDRIKETLPKDIEIEQALADKAQSIPLGRIGKPEELAATVVFLASEQASYITGTTIQVDGGANRGIF